MPVAFSFPFVVWSVCVLSLTGRCAGSTCCLGSLVLAGTGPGEGARAAERPAVETHNTQGDGEVSQADQRCDKEQIR